MKSVLYSLLVTDESSTFETVNEVNNFDWRFETADAFAKGLATGLSSGQHELIYTMNFIDIHNAVTPQDIKISFIV